jgi:hypothetical protein
LGRARKAEDRGQGSSGKQLDFHII